jgi:hypothetical protein
MSQSETISSIAPVTSTLDIRTPDCGANSGEQGLFRADCDQDLLARHGIWSSRFAVPSTVQRGAMNRIDVRDAWRGEYGPIITQLQAKYRVRRDRLRLFPVGRATLAASSRRYARTSSYNHRTGGRRAPTPCKERPAEQLLFVAKRGVAPNH